MKKNRLKQALDGELRSVHVSGDLKKRILAEAAYSRVPERRRSFSIRPLAAAAAVVLVLGVTAGVAVLRSGKPDVVATPLSSAKVKSEESMVWVRLPEGIYHASKDCAEVEDPIGMQLDTARAAGMKGCWSCIEPESAAADGLVWMPQQGSYYHGVKDCSGMTGALGVLEIEAKTLGRQACPVCLGGEFIPTIEETPMPSMVPVLLNEADVEMQYVEATLTPRPTPGPAEIVEATLTPWPTPEPAEIPQMTAAVTAEPTPEPEKWVAEPTAEPTEMAEAAVAVTPEPTVAPTMDAPIEPDAENWVWVTSGGLYYHADEHCSGMEGAVMKPEKSAALSEKMPCDACMVRTIWVDPETGVWHRAKNCSDMENAQEVLLQPGETVKYEGCPICMSGGVPVWTTGNAMFYHWDEHCSGLEGAFQIMQSEANGQPCPVCMEELSEKTVSYQAEATSVMVMDQGEVKYLQSAPKEIAADGPTAVFDTDVGDNVIVWMIDGGYYFHTDEHCSGMEGAEIIEPADAVAQGKQPCPVCGA